MRHGDITIDEAVTVLDRLGGRSVVNAMVAGQEIDLVKYGGFTLGQIAEAIPNMLGGEEVLQGLISGALKARRVGNELLIEPGRRPLFDRKGRRIPPVGLEAAVRDADPEYRLYQPELIQQRYETGLVRLAAAGLFTTISAFGFKVTADELFRQLREHGQLANALNGAHLPILVPRTKIKDYGQSAEKFVQAAAASYLRQFPGRRFVNHRQGELGGETTILDISRHEQLVEKIAHEAVIGIYFPNALPGFSVGAQRAQMASLPKGFLLSGVIDTAMGWVMYPDILGRDGQTPSYDCSANDWQCAPLLFFEASDKSAGFDNSSNARWLASGDTSSSDCGRHSGGLLYIGQ